MGEKERKLKSEPDTKPSKAGGGGGLIKQITQPSRQRGVPHTLRDDETRKMRTVMTTNWEATAVAAA